jgi:hypothetical protein
MNRQKLLLSILLVSFVISVVYGYLRMPRQKTVDKTGPALVRKTSEKTPVANKPEDKKLHLEMLDRTPPRIAGFRRNIFRPIFHEDLKALNLPPPPLPPKFLPKPPTTPPSTAPQTTTTAPPAVPEPPPYVRDMAAFKFLGFVKKDNRKTIFLAKSNDIFLVRNGDIISDKYEVTNISDEALTINVVAEGREIIIPLEENKALVPVKK